MPACYVVEFLCFTFIPHYKFWPQTWPTWGFWWWVSITLWMTLMCHPFFWLHNYKWIQSIRCKMCFGSEGNRYRPQLWFEFVFCDAFIWFGFVFCDEFVWLEFVFRDEFIWFEFVFHDEFVWFEFVFCDEFYTQSHIYRWEIYHIIKWLNIHGAKSWFTLT
jgi:hypothetical protein